MIYLIIRLHRLFYCTIICMFVLRIKKDGQIQLKLSSHYFHVSFLIIQIPVFGVRYDTSDLKSNQLTQIVAQHIASVC